MSNFNYFSQNEQQTQQAYNFQDDSQYQIRNPNIQTRSSKSLNKILESDCQYQTELQEQNFDFFGQTNGQEMNYHIQEFGDYENFQLEQNVNQVISTFLQPTYNGDIFDFPSLFEQQENYNQQENIPQDNIQVEPKEIIYQPTVNDNTSNLNHSSNFQNKSNASEDQNQNQIVQPQISEEISNTHSLPSKKKKIKKQISKLKQDNIYKGIFQRLCIICNDKPSNKSYKYHLVQLIVKAVRNQEQTVNFIVLEIAKKFDRYDCDLFINHLQNLLKICQNKLDVKDPSVTRALKSIYNTVALELMKLQ